MHADQRQELDAIRREQRELQTRLRELETRLEGFERRAGEAEKETPGAGLPPATTPAPPPVTPAMPPPLPVAPSAPSRPPVLAKASEPTVETPSLVAPPPPLPAAPPIPPVPRESLEMQIGTTWLVRIGVVLLLTGLAWMGSHLYHHIVPILGPAAKIALLYVGAGALTGLGAWLERSRLARETPKLGDYARVVFAGGLAAVYYVTYAAHWNPHLRVVDNPVLAGGLLLGWTAFMVSLADRRKSEALATFAILLAFYTSAVNEISVFTLVANLFLAGGAVWLLRRNLWRIFPFVSLLATFGSYGCWRFSHAYVESGALAVGVPPHLAPLSAGFWVEGGFLLLYWLLFTWAVFTTDKGVLPVRRRTGFATLNNSAFFLLTTWLLLTAYPGSFWKLALGFGVVLLTLAQTSRRLPLTFAVGLEEAYLLQGVLLVTLGLVSYFTDWQLGLVLAVQSVVLLWRAERRQSRPLLLWSYAVGCMSATYALRVIPNLERPSASWAFGLCEGTLLVVNAWWCQHAAEKSRGAGPAEAAAPSGYPLARGVLPTWFATLGSVVWFLTVEFAVRAEVARVPLLAGAAVFLTASVYLLRLRALPRAAQVYLSMAHLHWLLAYGGMLGLETPPPWHPLMLLASTLVLGHWWQWRRAGGTEGRTAQWDAILTVLLLNFWLRQHAPGGDAGWMAEASLLSLAVLGYGLLTRYRALAAAGQFLLLSSIVQFGQLWVWPHQPPASERLLALCPLLAMVTTLVVQRRFAPTDKPDRMWRVWLVGTYELAAVLLFLVWVEEYAFGHAFALLSLGGAAIFAAGCIFREKRWRNLSVLPTGGALIVFWFTTEPFAHRGWLSLLGALVLAGQQQFGKRWLKDDASGFFPAKAQGALITAAVFCAWAFLTARMARWEGSAFTLAASWSLFAPLVFAAGLVLRERVYRWLGLLILAATLGHIILFDVSHLDSLGRAISSFVLGLVVLGIGFVYNRYHAKFRDFL